MNVVVLQGTLAREPEVRVLPSGGEVVGFEVTTRRDGERAVTVPVAWAEAPAAARKLRVGSEVVVAGEVRRRFFRAGGATASRTEVVATGLVPAAARRRVEALLEGAMAEVLADGPPG